MTDLHPSEREGKAKKATSSFFRFLSKKPSTAVPSSNNNDIITARFAASESKNAQPQNIPLPSTTASTIHQRKYAVAVPPSSQEYQQQLNAKLDSLKVSTPPHSDDEGVGGHDIGSDRTDTDPLEAINSKIKDVLYKNENERWTYFWVVVEEATQVKRENIAYVLLGVIAVLSVWSSLGDSVCTFVGFAYPSVATYNILNPSPRRPPPSNAECIHWFRYWSIFAFIQCLDVTFGKLFAVFPLYQMCKVLLFLAASYSHWNVSGFFYSYAVMPIVKWIKKFNDKYIFTK